MTNFLNYEFWEFPKFDIFGIKFFFLICPIIKIPKISKFWNCLSIRYSAPFAILPIFILPFEINFTFYCSDSKLMADVSKIRNIGNSKTLLYEILNLTPSTVILIFAILKFRKIRRSTFRRSKIRP